MEDRVMIDWQRIFSLAVRWRLQRKFAGPSICLWTISTEFLVEAGLGECTRSGEA